MSHGFEFTMYLLRYNLFKLILSQAICQNSGATNLN